MLRSLEIIYGRNQSSLSASSPYDIARQTLDANLTNDTVPTRAQLNAPMFATISAYRNVCSSLFSSQDTPPSFNACVEL